MFKRKSASAAAPAQSLAPFFSILLIISSLFIAALFKMTVRRLSYALYRESERFNRAQDEYYKNLMKYRRAGEGGQLEERARKRFLERVKKGQIIQVIDGKAIVIH